ncbi:MAG: glycosyltransferase family 2 protein [Candidatus Omnitrophota bacterium]
MAANRSVYQNPKLGQAISSKAGAQNGLLTNAWRERVISFYRSMIPSHSESSKQIWLTTPDEIIRFDQRIKSDDENLSHIEYICLCDTIADIYDIVDFLTRLRKKLPAHAKLLYHNYNWFWALFFRLSGFLGVSRKRALGDFYSNRDLDCFLEMSGWENVKKIRRYILPVKIPLLHILFDNFLIRLPLLNKLSLNTFFVARKAGLISGQEYSASVLIPCKNEEGNIEAIVRRMPTFSRKLEFVFINDQSTDTTSSRIKEMRELFPEKNIVLVDGPGQGKGAAVREGIKQATGDICMIFDADMTVIPEDLPQFYEAMKMRLADFIHGTRLVYAQENGAFRLANLLGNLFFSRVFSYILDQRTTDTLCGVKVFWKRDWPLFEECRSILKDRDVWGDYNLIFGASRYGLKIAQLPVRYFERLEGITKMNSRIKNGFIMLRVAWHALWEVKFID